MQELPVWFQDWYSGAYWSADTGAFPCSDEEQAEWSSWEQATPEQGAQLLSTWEADPNPDLMAEEEEPEDRSGSYWLPIFFGKGGKGGKSGGGGKGKKGKNKGGRKGRATKKGFRPKGGKKGACFICGSPGLKRSAGSARSVARRSSDPSSCCHVMTSRPR